MVSPRMAQENGAGARQALDAFARAHGRAAQALFRAPGRVNLIGEHVDYNDGFVLPAAIDRCAWVAVRRRGDRIVSVRSTALGETEEFSLDDLAPRERRNWSDYVRGTAAALKRLGRLSGADLVVHGEVPLGAGLSSSAALEIAVGLALLHAGGLEPGLDALARAAQRAEHEFVGTRCGLMDQLASCFGRAGHAVLLDCRSFERQWVPLPRDLRLVVVNTMVRHSLAGSQYNARRADCERAAALLGFSSLRDAGLPALEAAKAELGERLYRRARHVVTENARVLSFQRAFSSGDLRALGALMEQSHESLRRDYEVSCPELDWLVAAAGRAPGAVGARMMGGGFGGCTINLVESGAVEQFSASVAADYARLSGRRPDVFVLSAVDGAGQAAL